MSKTMKYFAAVIFIFEIIICHIQAQDVPQSTHPIWSPDGTKIAFINNKLGVENDQPINFEVYTMHADGSHIIRHTFNQAFEADISWAPDGERLVFKSYRDGNDEIYMLELATGDHTNISQNPAREGSPSWGPDGKCIYFQSDRDHELGEIYAYDLNKKKTVRLTNNDFSESGAIWSPSRKEIAFVSNKDGDDDIYIMDINTNNLRQITNNPQNDWYPQWSPDGSSILFTYGDWNTDIWELRMVDIKSLDQKTLIKKVDSGNASWHPRGDKILFGSGKSGQGEIYLLDLETMKEVQLTRSSAF